jgi:hypothetical protein
MKLVDAGWDGEEPDVVITEIAALIEGNKFQMRSRMLCAFSLARGSCHDRPRHCMGFPSL